MHTYLDIFYALFYVPFLKPIKLHVMTVTFFVLFFLYRFKNNSYVMFRFLSFFFFFMRHIIFIPFNISKNLLYIEPFFLFTL